MPLFKLKLDDTESVMEFTGIVQKNLPSPTNILPSSPLISVSYFNFDVIPVPLPEV